MGVDALSQAKLRQQAQRKWMTSTLCGAAQRRLRCSLNGVFL